jgi:hypothetical protein
MTLRYAHLAPAHKVKAINGEGATSQLLHSAAVNGYRERV